MVKLRSPPEKWIAVADGEEQQSSLFDSNLTPKHQAALGMLNAVHEVNPVWQAESLSRHKGVEGATGLSSAHLAEIATEMRSVMPEEYEGFRAHHTTDTVNEGMELD